jgi:Asp-tRNA(Asn)/Glu-tRNA(Gln) amidotransferase A subunit family amidase
MKTGSSIAERTASEIASAIARGDENAADVVAAHFDRIDRMNPSLNMFVQLRREDALAEALAQDASARRGVSRGPLGGVPISVKSAVAVGGLRCETGARERAGSLASADAAIVARLRAAGAIVLGTTNVAEMLMAYESDNPLYGRTNNPWDVGRTAGGSSGGEAAAIAAGCSAGGIGSDGGGSIRVPAHFCGICGLKPTPGRIPSTGHQPACLGPFSVIGVVGPMARSVEDLQLLFDVIAGADDDDPLAAPYDRAALAMEREAPIRVGFFEDDGRTPVTVETAAAVREAARAAELSGFEVERFRPDVLDRSRELWGVFFAKAGAALLHDVMRGAERSLPILSEFSDGDPVRLRLSDRELLDAWLERDLLRARLLRDMRRCRVLLCPVAAVPAFRHGEREWIVGGRRVRYLDAMSYTVWFNLLGNPSVVVPVGRSPEGLPIGVQVVGRPHEEEVVLAVAAAIERVCGRAPLIQAQAPE